MGRAQARQVAPHEMSEQPHLDVGHQLVADPVGQQRLDQLEDAARDAGPGDGQGNCPERLRIVPLDHLAHRRLQQLGQVGGQQPHRHRAAHSRGEGAQVRAQIVLEHPRHQPPALLALQLLRG